MIFITYWVTVLTFRDFFFFNPTQGVGAARQITLWLALIGWILAAVGTPVAMFAAAAGSLWGLRAMPITALWWPVSVFLTQVVLLVTTGNFYGGYLVNFPIFVLTDIAIPVFVLYKWSVLRGVLTKSAAEGEPPSA